ncbi:MAG: alcohol dehydrogenase catalytic domain-containing protein [Acidimicrobiales bacterium]|nr:alcohol dehydrogenase catalytic domain-containing protein [Acidimicrobiales bacterium]
MGESMKAAVLGGGPGKLAVEDVPVPDVGDGEVLVAVDLCGICGSDLHMVLDGWGRKGSWEGHEWVGRVEAVGPAVQRWNVGDVVVGGPMVRCGECEPCSAGRPSLCAERDTPGVGAEHGGFATYKLTRESDLLPMPDGLDARAAALAEPLAVALHGIHQGRVQPGQSVLVMGAGPIGALTIAALRAMGVNDVRCSEPTPVRRELAAAVGATRVVSPDDLIVPSIAEPGLVVNDAVDVVLECSGNGKAMEAGLAQLKRAGILVLVGAGMAAPKFDPNRILLNEVTITGAFTYDFDGFERALALLSGGKMPVDALLEPGTVGLDELLDTMRGLASGEIAGKVLVKP